MQIDIAEFNFERLSSKRIKKGNRFFSDNSTSIIELTKSNFSQVDFRVFPLVDETGQPQLELEASLSQQTSESQPAAQVLPSENLESRETIDIEPKMCLESENTNTNVQNEIKLDEKQDEVAEEKESSESKRAEIAEEKGI